MRAWALLAVMVAGSGCDTLFPEFAGKPPADMAMGDGGVPDGGDTTPRLAGNICVLTDLRDYRSCSGALVGSFRVTVEETRDQVMSDSTGRFTLPLTRKLDAATLAAVDVTGRFAPSVMPLSLANGVLTGVAVPVVEQAALAVAAAQNGASLDPNRGAVLGWVVDPSGVPIMNVAIAPAGLAEGGSPNQLFAATATGPRGTVAAINAAPPSLTWALTPPPATLLKPDRYNLPVRAGALTLSRIVLLP